MPGGKPRWSVYSGKRIFFSFDIFHPVMRHDEQSMMPLIYVPVFQPLSRGSRLLVFVRGRRQVDQFDDGPSQL